MLKADLHIHTDYSDGKDSVRKILESSINKGLDIIAITDHDTVEGALEAMDIVEEEGLQILVLPGIEVSAYEGHVLVYGVERDFEKGITVSELASKVRKLEGVIALAHPFNILKKGVINPSKFMEIVDAVEVFNARCYLGITNKLSKHLCKKFKKSMIAGSDAHSAKMVGYGLTIFNGSRTLNQVLNDIKVGKTQIIEKRIPIRIQIKHLAFRVMK